LSKDVYYVLLIYLNSLFSAINKPIYERLNLKIERSSDACGAKGVISLNIFF